MNKGEKEVFPEDPQFDELISTKFVQNSINNVKYKKFANVYCIMTKNGNPTRVIFIYLNNK